MVQEGLPYLKLSTALIPATKPRQVPRKITVYPMRERLVILKCLFLSIDFVFMIEPSIGINNR